MNDIVNSSIKTISKSNFILKELTNQQLSDTSIPPYNSCIGSHVRHILDFYRCIFKGYKSGHVDLTDRDRDLKIEQDCQCAIQNVTDIIDRLELLKSENASDPIKVIDDLGQGKITIDYTLGSLLAQANSHTIHHYAIISYILDQLGIVINDPTFGYNPTTPISDFNLN